jgi:hypothetical protein
LIQEEGLLTQEEGPLTQEEGLLIPEEGLLIQGKRLQKKTEGYPQKAKTTKRELRPTIAKQGKSGKLGRAFRDG